MRHILQLLRDFAETQSQLAAEANDRDSANAWEHIAFKCDCANRDIRYEWQVIQERQGPDAHGDVLRQVMGNLHASSVVKT